MQTFNEDRQIVWMSNVDLFLASSEFRAQMKHKQDVRERN